MFAKLKFHQRFCVAILAIAMSFSSIFLFAGCGKAEYTAYVVPYEREEEIQLPEAERDSITIGNCVYQVSYQYSISSLLRENDKILGHVYSVKEHAGALDATIELNADGALQYFSGIIPFENVADHQSMSDVKLKSAVQKILKNSLGSLVDFSQYNQCDITRSAHNGGTTRIRWGAEYNGYEQAKHLAVALDQYGNINYFSMSDSCDKNFRRPFVSDSERDALIMSAVEEYYAKEHPTKQLGHFEIMGDASLSVIEGKRCVVYSVIVYDSEGWSEIRFVRIVEGK